MAVHHLARRTRRRAAPIAIALLVAGCHLLAPETPRLVNGWSIGTEIDCAADPDCELLAAVALAELDRIEPDHPAVVAWAMHDESWYPSPDDPSAKILATRSGGCCDIYLARLADGRTVAIGVGYPGISQEPIAFLDGPANWFLGSES